MFRALSDIPDDVSYDLVVVGSGAAGLAAATFAASTGRSVLVPGTGRGGRSVCAAPFDGRTLGRRLDDLKALDEIAPSIRAESIKQGVWPPKGRPAWLLTAARASWKSPVEIPRR